MSQNNRTEKDQNFQVYVVKEQNNKTFSVPFLTVHYVVHPSLISHYKLNSLGAFSILPLACLTGGLRGPRMLDFTRNTPLHRALCIALLWRWIFYICLCKRWQRIFVAFTCGSLCPRFYVDFLSLILIGAAQNFEFRCVVWTYLSRLTFLLVASSTVYAKAFGNCAGILLRISWPFSRGCRLK